MPPARPPDPAALSGRPAQLTPSSAFLILPIAHTYNMAALLQSCIEVAQRSLPSLWMPDAIPVSLSASLPASTSSNSPAALAGPSTTSASASHSSATPPAPATLSPTFPQSGASTSALGPTFTARTFTASSPGPSPDPGLFDWLALADAKQLTPLVDSCLSHLSGAAEAGAVVRSALAWPHSRSCLERLCSETMMELLNVTTGLPASFRVMPGRWLCEQVSQCRLLCGIQDGSCWEL